VGSEEEEEEYDAYKKLQTFNSVRRGKGELKL
jgi:hypothetical protein